MKATEQHLFPCFIMLNNFFLSFDSVTIQITATEQYFHVVLFVMLIRVVLTFDAVIELPSVI